MSTFTMPSLGADMDSGTLVEWLVKPGDTVHRGDIVAVVDTADSAVELEVFTSGVVEDVLVPVGQEVPVGTPLVRLRDIPAPAAPAPALPAAPAPTPGAPWQPELGTWWAPVEPEAAPHAEPHAEPHAGPGAPVAAPHAGPGPAG